MFTPQLKIEGRRAREREHSHMSTTFVSLTPASRADIDDTEISVFAIATSDPEIQLRIAPGHTYSLSPSQCEMLETALRVARQSVRPKR